MSRLESTFLRLRTEDRLGFVAYVTAGYPGVDSTPELVEALVGAGADVIEIGVPFSDPLGEGRTIQRTSQRALANGMTVGRCLEAVRESRALVEAPIVLMGYVNPILAYGTGRFCTDAAQAGADGLIVLDLPLEETEDLYAHCQAAGLDLVFLLAPTSTDARIETAARLASGFIYCISLTGVTGSRESVSPDAQGLVDRVREATNLPITLGFGISRPEHLMDLAGKVDAVAVGSALLDAIDPERAPQSARDFVHWMRGA